LLTPESFGYRAAWSPDDRWIAFMSNHEEWNDDIYIIEPDGSNMQRLTTDPSVDDYPKWVLAGSVAVNENS
jgi:Tol biopolymer transport system component